jgi:predicted membrane channel-forming protein YqfA (hemolysin III family)
MKPTLRKPVGVLGLIAGLAIYAVLAINLIGGPVERLPALVQAPIYLILGTIWILPLRPLLIWMETGRWTAPK